MRRVIYIQGVAGGVPCDKCPENAVGEVKDLVTEESITTLCDEHLEEEGWL